MYSSFKYEKPEWDNVAQVVPRFSFHLESNVRELSHTCAELVSRETTKHLREDIEARLQEVRDKAKEHRDTDLEEKERIKETTDGLNQKIVENAEALGEW